MKNIPKKKKMELELLHEMELIHKIGLQITSELDLNKLLQLIVNQIKETLHYSYCSILLKQGDDLIIRAVTDFPEDIIGKRIPIGQGVTGRCATLEKELLISDLSKCKFYIHLGEESFQSELAVPIIYKENVLGVLNTESIKKNAYNGKDVRILKILSNQLAGAIHNAQVHTQLELVQNIGIQLVSIMNLDELLSGIVQETKDTLHYDSCAILLLEGENLIVKAITEFPEEIMRLKIPIGKGITGKCAKLKKIINIGEIPRYDNYIPSGIEGIQSEIALPILFRDEILGVLTIESKRKNAFDEDDIRVLSILTSQIAVAIHNSKIYSEMEKMAVTDPLTGLYNYRYFYKKLSSEIARSKRYNHPLSLILIDLDDFKLINDIYGHLKGDTVLKSAAGLIIKNIRGWDEAVTMRSNEIDIAARYGGEEFMIILPETGIDEALVAGERLRKIIEENLTQKVNLRKKNGSFMRITGSFGVTSYKEEDMENFLKRTDRAMYKAKKLGKNRVYALK
ncbi:MAG: sensor domain-containing diguanylate cyclase [Acidobacteriota bacterium]